MQLINVLMKTLLVNYYDYYLVIYQNLPTFRSILLIIDSPLLKDCKEKLAGVLVLYKNKNCCEILSAHTTKSMCVSYATKHIKQVCI